MNWLMIAIGGAVGSMMRYGLGMIANQSGVPYGTWTANVAGSFLIGLFFVWGKEKGVLPDYVSLFLTSGLMGGFTTFSTFSLEVVTMALQGESFRALFYVLASIVMGLAAAYAGIRLGRLIFV